MLSDIILDNSTLKKSIQGWVITDDKNTILGLPPILEAAENAGFDEAGIGVCLIESEL